MSWDRRRGKRLTTWTFVAPLRTLKHNYNVNVLTRVATEWIALAKFYLSERNFELKWCRRASYQAKALPFPHLKSAEKVSCHALSRFQRVHGHLGTLRTPRVAMGRVHVDQNCRICGQNSRRTIASASGLLIFRQPMRAPDRVTWQSATKKEVASLRCRLRGDGFEFCFEIDLCCSLNTGLSNDTHFNVLLADFAKLLAIARAHFNTCLNGRENCWGDFTSASMSPRYSFITLHMPICVFKEAFYCGFQPNPLVDL
jgi:hypothetical protein